MGWRVFADWYTTAESSGTSKAQKVTLTDPLVLLACRVWLVQYNNPALTALTLKVYSDNGGSVGDLLYTSGSRTKADIFTESNSCVETYFEFNAPHGVNLGTGVYHFALGFSGYTGTENAHIAWKKSWPETPPNLDGFTASFENVGTAPYCLTFIGAED